MISKYKEHLQLLCAVNQLCDLAFVGPDVMGELVDDISTMFDRYHLITSSGYCFGTPPSMFASLASFF